MPEQDELILVTLNDAQMVKAKQANGERERITTALVCGNHGQLFGTDNRCRKYYDTWSEIYPELFSRAYETGDYDGFDSFHTTPELTSILIDASDEILYPDDPSDIRPRDLGDAKGGAGCLGLLVALAVAGLAVFAALIA